MHKITIASLLAASFCLASTTALAGDSEQGGSKKGLLETLFGGRSDGATDKSSDSDRSSNHDSTDKNAKELYKQAGDSSEDQADKRQIETSQAKDLDEERDHDALANRLNTEKGHEERKLRKGKDNHHGQRAQKEKREKEEREKEHKSYEGHELEIGHER